MGNIEENADEYKRKHGELPHNHTHAHTDDHSHSHSHTHSKEHSHSSVKEIDEATHEKMHEEGYTHVHIKDHGIVKVKIATQEEIDNKIVFIDKDAHTHTHADGSEHGHQHDPAHTKKILNRFSRAIGHMQHVKLMVENGIDCSDVLVQLAAVKSSVNNIGREILKEHLTHCIINSVEHGDEDVIDTLNQALDQFMK